MKKLFVVLFVLALAAALSISATAAETDLLDTKMTPPVLASDPDKEIAALESYTIDIPANDVDVVQPINVTQKGRLIINLESNAPKQRYLELYADEACTMPVNSKYRVILSGETKQHSFPIPEAATYYLKIYPQYPSNISTESGTINLKACVASAANRTLKSGKYSVGASSQTDQSTYYKISVAEAGYIGFHQKNPSGFDFVLILCDKNKKEIHSRFVGSSNNYFPVKKGTYYIYTEGILASYADWYQLKYTFYKQTSSTFTMTNNKTKKITPFNKETFYLRIKAEKTGTLALTNGEKNGMYVTLCNSKKSALTDNAFLYGDAKYFAVNKGTTYYIKFESNNAVALKYKITGVSTTSNTTKAKATTLKKGKAQKLNFVAGSTKSYWVKFKASASVPLDLDCVFSGVGYYDYVAYKGSTKIGNASLGSGTRSITSLGKLTKGTTYYLKLTPQKKTTGTLSIKLNS